VRYFIKTSSIVVGYVVGYLVGTVAGRLARPDPHYFYSPYVVSAIAEPAYASECKCYVCRVYVPYLHSPEASYPRFLKKFTVSIFKEYHPESIIPIAKDFLLHQLFKKVIFTFCPERTYHAFN